MPDIVSNVPAGESETLCMEVLSARLLVKRPFLAHECMFRLLVQTVTNMAKCETTGREKGETSNFCEKPRRAVYTTNFHRRLLVIIGFRLCDFLNLSPTKTGKRKNAITNKETSEKRKGGQTYIIDSDEPNKFQIVIPWMLDSSVRQTHHTTTSG